MIHSYCANPSTCGKRNADLFALNKVKCESSLQAHQCAQLAKENPEKAHLIRKCDTASICGDNAEFMKDKNLACLIGYKNAAVDWGVGIKDLTVGLGTFIGESVAKGVINIKNKNEFIKTANEDAEKRNDATKKRLLVFGIPRFDKMSDDELKKIPAAYLDSQANEYRYLQSTQKRMAHKDLPDRLKDPAELDSETQRQKDALMEMAARKLAKEYDRYNCYTPVAQEELQCYAIGAVFDPLAVAGYFAKGGRAAASVVKTASVDGNYRRSGDVKRFFLGDKRTPGATTSVATAKPKISSAAPPKTVSSLPSSLKIEKIQEVDGTNYLRYTYAEEMPGGVWVKNAKELPLDELTGAINANFSTGREFFERLAQGKAGKSHLAFIDVGSLGAVNNKFKAGTEAGDRYLKAVAEEIMKNGEGKVTLARLGGDEFGVLIDSADPQDVKRIMDNIQKGVRQGPAKQVFREEKIVLAEAYREEAKALAAQRPDGKLTDADKQTLRQNIDELAKIQNPDISVGTAQVGRHDNLEELLAKTEDQAREMKIGTALNSGRSAKKYGSGEAPRASPDPRYLGEISGPVTSSSWKAKPSAVTIRNFDELEEISVVRKEEIARFGANTLARYEDQLGRSSYRVEKYHTDATGRKQRIGIEIPTRGNTGLLDGQHPESKRLVMDHVGSSAGGTLLMPKLRSLKYLNYFEDGTKAGDEVLAVVAKSLQANTRAEDLTFKLGGADYLVSLKNSDPASLARITQKVQQDVQKSPEIKAIIDRERTAIAAKLTQAIRNGDKVKTAELRESMENIKNFNLDLQFQSISAETAKSKASFDEVVKTLDGQFKR